MKKTELQEIKEALEAKGIDFEEAAKKIDFDPNLLRLYLSSSMVPVSVIKPLRELLES